MLIALAVSCYRDRRSRTYESFDFDFRFLLPPEGFTTMEGLGEGRLSFKPGPQSQEPTMPELGVQLTSYSAKFTLILGHYHCVA